MSKLFPTHTLARWLIAGVWLVNGLFCKVLGLVPRHEMIVERVLRLEDGALLTKAIGLGEILIAVWVASRCRARLAGWVQILLVASMNLLEFWLAPDLLLFGRINLLVAGAFMVFVYIHSVRPPPPRRSEP